MLDKLSPRERLMGIGLIALLSVVGLFMGIKTFMKMREKVTVRVTNARRDVQRITNIRNTIRSLPPPQPVEEKTIIVAKASRLATELGLKPADIRDGEEISNKFRRVRVELTFRSVPLKDILKYVHSVESGGQINVQVSSLVFSRSLNKEVYDVNLSLFAQSPVAKKTGKDK